MNNLNSLILEGVVVGEPLTYSILQLKLLATTETERGKVLKKNLYLRL